MRRKSTAAKIATRFEGSVATLALIHAVAEATLLLNLKVTVDIAVAIKFAIVLKMEVFLMTLVTQGIGMVTALGTREG